MLRTFGARLVAFNMARDNPNTRVMRMNILKSNYNGERRLHTRSFPMRRRMRGFDTEYYLMLLRSNIYRNLILNIPISFFLSNF
jgi:hypothetical protein